MKKLELNGVRPPIDPGSPILQQRFYTVHLGNRRTVMFTSERAALAFQAQTDRWISSHLNNCNFMLADAFSAYRSAWFLLDQTKVAKAEDKAREYIESAWRGMDMALVKCSGPSGWVFGWSYLAGAVGAVRSLALLLRDLHRSRNNPVERARMELLIERSQLVLEQMQHYGETVKGATSVRQTV